MCNAPLVFPSINNYSVCALTSVRIARIDGKDILSVMERSPSIVRAFWLDMLTTAAIRRE
ncbi:hypothetical protein SAMN04487843_13619 [Methylobacterium sp. ap11]|nr:hypothetical protein SAMN04487843_13619 [Methylobacterium sp. ap11]